MGQASQADPSIGAAIMLGEAVDAAAASSPAGLLPMPASTPAGAIADSSAELSVAADVGMAEASPLAVVPDLPVLGHEEKVVVVAEVGDRRPPFLAEKRPSMSIAAVPEALAARGPDALAEGQSRGTSWGAAALSPCGSTSMSGVGGRSYSGAAPPRTRSPSSPSMMSWRRGLGIISMSMSRRRRGRFGRPWRPFPGMFLGSSS
jgi:hypothetical protein